MFRLFTCLMVLIFSANIVQAQQPVQFVNPIPVPYKMEGPNFSLDISAKMHNFDPNGGITGKADRFGESLTPANINVPLQAYCYNGTDSTGMTYLGPTLIVEKGTQVSFDIKNSLPGTQRTTVHWHGLNLPASADGGPHQVINNGAWWNSSFRMIDPSQTVWYHTHLMDSTTIQVIRGLAGMMIVKDPNNPLENQLPRDYGVNDIPIIIQEKDFIFDNGTNIATDIKASEKPGNGRFTLVNGVAGGVMPVPQSMVRLRFLNGSPRKMYGLAISTNRNEQNPASFFDMYQVATGGGYLNQVKFVDSTLLSVGDRKDFVVDFAQFANGDTVYLINCYLPIDALYLNGPPSNAPTSPMPASADRAIMAFVIDNTIQPSPVTNFIPVSLDVNYALAPGDVFKTRTKRLMGGNGQKWTINGDTMNMGVINDTVLVNTKERWIIKNETNHAHPFHIHKVQFQVVEYNGKLDFRSDSATYTYDSQSPNSFPDELFGWKDVQLVRAGATMTFEARFDSFPSPAISPMEGFMYHCHILTHEDNSMMAQFVVVDSLAFYTNTNKISITKSLFVFPNPAGDMISFDAADINDKGTLRIYDITGRMLREENNMFLSGRSSINVSDLPRGMIFVEFRTEKERFLQKVLLR